MYDKDFLLCLLERETNDGVMVDFEYGYARVELITTARPRWHDIGCEHPYVVEEQRYVIHFRENRGKL